jgi:hypothetical protein
MTLAPRIDGTVAVRSSAAQLLLALRQRVATGLVLGRPHPRSRYQVSEAGPNHLRIRAADWPTAINVGLNEVDIRLAQPGAAHFRVRYWRWAAYVLGLGGVLGLVGLGLLLAVDVRGYLAQHPTSRLPGLSIDQSVAVAWTLVLFWGFAWPWLLIALHKRPLRRLVARLIAEVDAQAASVSRVPVPPTAPSR